MWKKELDVKIKELAELVVKLGVDEEKVVEVFKNEVREVSKVSKIFEWYEVTLVQEDHGRIRKERQGEFTKEQIEDKFLVKVPEMLIGERRDVNLNYFLDYLIIRKVETGIRL